MRLTLLFSLFLPLLGFAQEKIVGGYYPYYRTANSIDWSGYTHVYFAFGFPTSDGGLSVNESSFNDFITKSEEYQFKKYISLGTTGFPEMATEESNRLQFVDTLIKFCEHYDLDGIDMDWELIDNPMDSSNFRKLMEEIRVGLDGKDLEFIATIGYGDWALKWYSNQALEQADFLQIMIYDRAGTWADSPFDNHASWDHFLEAEVYWNDRGFSDDQLVMGVPYYGYKFNSTSGGLAEAVSYEEIYSRFPDLSPEDNYRSDESGYYWFNGQDLIKQKREYVFDNEFLGIFTWEMSQDVENDDRSLHKALMGDDYPTGLSNVELSQDWYSIENSQLTITNSGVLSTQVYSASGSKLAETTTSTLNEIPSGQVLIIKGNTSDKVLISKVLIVD